MLTKKLEAGQVHYTNQLTGSDTLDGLQKRATGRYYTPKHVARQLAQQVIDAFDFSGRDLVRIIDPFSGDGRLIEALVGEIADRLPFFNVTLEIECWDIDVQALLTASRVISKAADEHGIRATVIVRCADSFLNARNHLGQYDVVVTNPPWENLRPDSRELRSIPSLLERENYKKQLKYYDQQLAKQFPDSQPARKFAGWGTNLSRVGVDLAAQLCRDGGVVALIAPSSFLADQMTIALRRRMLRQMEWICVDDYPAEAKLFPGVDQGFVTLLLRNTVTTEFEPRFRVFHNTTKQLEEKRMFISLDDLAANDYSLNVASGELAVALAKKWQNLQHLESLRAPNGVPLWTGRELDETKDAKLVEQEGEIPFVKGRNIRRFEPVREVTGYITQRAAMLPASRQFNRAVWRDVARRSQARRMHATTLEAGVVTGNSLHVAYFSDGDWKRTQALVGIMNSLPFELQVRSRSGTGHMPLGVVRKVRVPDLTNGALVEQISHAVDCISDGGLTQLVRLEILVAKAYGLRFEEFRSVVDFFERLPTDFVHLASDVHFWESAPCPV